MKYNESKDLVDHILSSEKNRYRIARYIKWCIGDSSAPAHPFKDPANPFMDMAEDAIEEQRLFEYDTEQERIRDIEDVFEALKNAVARLITDGTV